MFVTYSLCVLVCCLLLFVPGGLMGLSFRLTFAQSLALAPALSLAAFTVAGLGTSLVPGAKAYVVFIALVVAACWALRGAVELAGAWAARRRQEHRPAHLPAVPQAQAADKPTLEPRVWVLFFYMLVGAATLWFIYSRCLYQYDSVLQLGDNRYHLNVIDAMVRGGNFSTLQVSPYPADTPANELPFLGTSYYPAAFHELVALTAKFAGVSVALAEQGALFALCGVVYPLGLGALLEKTGKRNLALTLAGPFVAMACLAFPLRTLLVHQIYSNIAGFCLIFNCVYALMVFTDRVFNPCRGWTRAFAGIALALCAAALVFLQPSSFLGAFPFLFAFMEVVWSRELTGLLAARARSLKPRAVHGAILALGLLAFAGIWYAVLKAPFMKGVVGWYWGWTIPAPDALLQILNMGVMFKDGQILFAVLAWTGFVFCLFRKELRWMPLAFAICCVVFFFNATGDMKVKQFFSGFWYTDPERTAALLAIGAVPLAAAGMGAIAWGLSTLVARLFKRREAWPAVTALFIAAIAAPFIWANYQYYTFESQASGEYKFSNIGQTQISIYGLTYPWAPVAYDSADQAFVWQVKQLVGDDLVINTPYDGSIYADVMNGLNTYYRSDMQGHETGASDMIRHYLDQIATSKPVQKAVKRIGAKYVLQLQSGDNAFNDTVVRDHNAWIGINDITPETPGFKLVLEEGDNRLYQIEDF